MGLSDYRIVNHTDLHLLSDTSVNVVESATQEYDGHVEGQIY